MVIVLNITHHVARLILVMKCHNISFLEENVEVQLFFKVFLNDVISHILVLKIVIAHFEYFFIMRLL